MVTTRNRLHARTFQDQFLWLNIPWFLSYADFLGPHYDSSTSLTTLHHLAFCPEQLEITYLGPVTRPISLHPMIHTPHLLRRVTLLKDFRLTPAPSSFTFLLFSYPFNRSLSYLIQGSWRVHCLVWLGGWRYCLLLKGQENSRALDLAKAIQRDVSNGQNSTAKHVHWRKHQTSKGFAQHDILQGP